MIAPPSTYSVERGYYDDLVDEAGRLRSHWEPLAGLLGAEGR